MESLPGGDNNTIDNLPLKLLKGAIDLDKMIGESKSGNKNSARGGRGKLKKPKPVHTAEGTNLLSFGHNYQGDRVFLGSVYVKEKKERETKNNPDDVIEEMLEQGHFCRINIHKGVFYILLNPQKKSVYFFSITALLVFQMTNPNSPIIALVNKLIFFIKLLVS